MGELTAGRPKCLVELGGQPLLHWQIDALQAAGIEKIGIVAGWHKEQLRGYGTTLFENARWAETNMVVSLACATTWLQGNTCVVSYSDIFYAPRAVSALLALDAGIAITYDRDWLALWSRRFSQPMSDAETFEVDDRGYLTDIGRRAASLDQISGQYMGLLRFTPDGWHEVLRFLSEISGDERDRLDMTTLLRHLIARGVRIATAPIDCRWGEVDSTSDLALYERDIAAGLLTPPRPAGTQ